MYMTRATINGLEETAVYPMVIEVAQDLQDILGLSTPIPIRIGENPPLYLTKDTNYVNRHIPDIPDEELFIEYTEVGLEDYDITLTSLVPTTQYIYKDKDVRSTIKPILTKRKLVLNITYKAKSKSKISSVINRLKMRNPKDVRNVYHNLEYYYYIPDIVIELLDNINTLKNTYTNPPIDLDEYIANTFITSAKILNDESGSPYKLSLVIREKQLNCLGSIETDLYGLQKEDSVDDTGRYRFSIEYSVTYELPTQLLVTYPITVYNQPIAKKFRLKNKLNIRYGHRTLDSDALQKLSIREEMLFRIPDHSYYLHIPPEDNLVLPKPDSGYIRLFSIYTILDPNDRTYLFYLDEIPHIKFKKSIEELIKLEANRMGDEYASIFFMRIYDYDKPVYNTKVKVIPVTEVIDGKEVERIKIVAEEPLDIKGAYRVDFQILTDLSCIPIGVKDTIRHNIEAVDIKLQLKDSVVDDILEVFNLDYSKLDPNLVIGTNTTSWDIYCHIRDTYPMKVFTKEYALIVTGMLEEK